MNQIHGDPRILLGAVYAIANTCRRRDERTIFSGGEQACLVSGKSRTTRRGEANGRTGVYLAVSLGVVTGNSRSCLMQALIFFEPNIKIRDIL